MALQTDADDTLLLREIQQLRAELRGLRREEMAPLDPKTRRHELNISIDAAAGERKPYVFRCCGAHVFELRLSPIRTALLLALFLELQSRATGLRSSHDAVTWMKLAYRHLDPTPHTEDEIISLVRVGLYRLELALTDSNALIGKLVALAYSAQSNRLEFAPTSEVRELKQLAITVSSTCKEILEIIDSLSAASPLARVRAQRSLYISSSEQGWDRLFLEYFDHSLPVRNTSLFYRPGLATFPDRLLKAIGASDATMRRRAVMLEGYKHRRVEIVEVLTRETLWDMIRVHPSGTSRFYPPHTPADMIVEHLEEMLRQLKSFDSYHLSLTDAVFPFIIGVVELGGGQEREYFSMFYRNFDQGAERDMNCFVLYDKLVAQSMLDRVIAMVREHPSTTSDRAEVISEIERVLAHVRADGLIVEGK